MEFEWHEEKAESNHKKHGVRFSEAVTIWLDVNALEMPDPEHSKYEERWIRLGLSSNTNVLVVIYCEIIDNERVRIISARKATKTETNAYYKR